MGRGLARKRPNIVLRPKITGGEQELTTSKSVLHPPISVTIRSRARPWLRRVLPVTERQRPPDGVRGPAVVGSDATSHTLGPAPVSANVWRHSPFNVSHRWDSPSTGRSPQRPTGAPKEGPAGCPTPSGSAQFRARFRTRYPPLQGGTPPPPGGERGSCAMILPCCLHPCCRHLCRHRCAGARRGSLRGGKLHGWCS